VNFYLIYSHPSHQPTVSRGHSSVFVICYLFRIPTIKKLQLDLFLNLQSRKFLSKHLQCSPLMRIKDWFIRLKMLLQSFTWSKRLISWKMRVLFRSKRLNTCSIWYCHSGESYSPEQTATVEQFIDTLQGISLFLCYLFLCDCGFSKHLFYCANVGCIMSIFPNYVTCYSLIGQPSLKFDNYMREKNTIWGLFGL